MTNVLGHVLKDLKIINLTDVWTFRCHNGGKCYFTTKDYKLLGSVSVCGGSCAWSVCTTSPWCHYIVGSSLLVKKCLGCLFNSVEIHCTYHQLKSRSCYSFRDIEGGHCVTRTFNGEGWLRMLKHVDFGVHYERSHVQDGGGPSSNGGDHPRDIIEESSLISTTAA